MTKDDDLYDAMLTGFLDGKLRGKIGPSNILYQAKGSDGVFQGGTIMDMSGKQLKRLDFDTSGGYMSKTVSINGRVRSETHRELNRTKTVRFIEKKYDDTGIIYLKLKDNGITSEAFANKKLTKITKKDKVGYILYIEFGPESNFQMDPTPYVPEDFVDKLQEITKFFEISDGVITYYDQEGSFVIEYDSEGSLLTTFDNNDKKEMFAEFNKVGSSKVQFSIMPELEDSIFSTVQFGDLLQIDDLLQMEGSSKMVKIK